MLTLPEQLLLLALHDQKGTILSSASISINYGLAGAVLTELALREKVEIRDKKLVLLNRSLTGDDILDAALTQIINSAKERKADHWVNKLAGSKMRLKQSILERLVKKGILKVEEHKILWVFDSPHYPMKDASEEKTVREKLRRLLLRREEAEARTVALMGLVSACGLTGEIFTRTEIKEAKQKIKAIMKNDPVAKAVADTVEGVQAAVIVAVVAGSSHS
ncbi:MAG: GPP34 family phosphoprotein [Syntrophomonadaceae bacterium]